MRLLFDKLKGCLSHEPGSLYMIIFHRFDVLRLQHNTTGSFRKLNLNFLTVIF